MEKWDLYNSVIILSFFFVVCFFFRCLENRPPLSFNGQVVFPLTSQVSSLDGPLTGTVYLFVGKSWNPALWTVRITWEIFWGIGICMIQSLIYNMITSQENRHNLKSLGIFFWCFCWSPSCLAHSPQFKAVVKQTECLEAKTFGLGCLGQDFILWSYVMRSLSKLIKAVDDEILTDTPLQSFR